MNVTNTTNKQIAKAIDLINQFVLDYRSRKTEIEPTPENAHLAILKKDSSLYTDIFDDALMMMKHLGYIKFIEAEPPYRGTIKKLVPTDKGLLLHLNGGLTKQIEIEERKLSLYRWGQIAVIIAGLYYLFEIVKDLKLFILYLYSC